MMSYGDWHRHNRNDGCECVKLVLTSKANVKEEMAKEDTSPTKKKKGRMWKAVTAASFMIFYVLWKYDTK